MSVFPSAAAAAAAVSALVGERHRLVRWAHDLAGELGLDLARAADRHAFIDLLEAPDCACDKTPVPCRCDGPCDCPPFIMPCEHLLRANNGLSFTGWTYLLHLLDARGYDPPLTAGDAAPALTRAARVNRLRKRQRLHQRLFDGRVCLPADVGRRGGHERNGRDIADETLVSGKEDRRPPPAPRDAPAAGRPLLLAYRLRAGKGGAP